MKSSFKLPQLNPFIEQQGSKGKPFRFISAKKLLITEKWVNRDIKYHWLHVFEYIDKSELFAIETDYSNNFYKLYKDYEFTPPPREESFIVE